MPDFEYHPDEQPAPLGNRVELIVAIGKYLGDIENDVRFVGEPKDVGWHEMHGALAALAQSDEISIAGLALIAAELGVLTGANQEADSLG
ncbi:hypothetical protein [Antrihabitans cavernicola]|uniref:Uncharacterized protein n=1 Tax=Antrihabitans cavernicola TaxID=2495913 RepID=A0A5A7SEE3_9NOCA|nr:hypothetical protein [Spelaeibacter cavernicola]KAA0023954.1 hypothetical protein FOY51_05075 [Spelaeibacter cavernicola]